MHDHHEPDTLIHAACRECMEHADAGGYCDGRDADEPASLAPCASFSPPPERPGELFANDVPDGLQAELLPKTPDWVSEFPGKAPASRAHCERPVVADVPPCVGAPVRSALELSRAVIHGGEPSTPDA